MLIKRPKEEKNTVKVLVSGLSEKPPSRCLAAISPCFVLMLNVSSLTFQDVTLPCSSRDTQWSSATPVSQTPGPGQTALALHLPGEKRKNSWCVIQAIPPAG